MKLGISLISLSVCIILTYSQQHLKEEDRFAESLDERVALRFCVAQCLELTLVAPPSASASPDSPCGNCYYKPNMLQLIIKAVPLETGCYMFGKKSLQWDDAMQFCKSRGFRLVSLETVRERQVVSDHLVKINSESDNFNVTWWTSGTYRPPSYYGSYSRLIWAGTGCELSCNMISLWRKVNPPLDYCCDSCYSLDYSNNGFGLTAGLCNRTAHVVCEWPGHADQDANVTLSTGKYLLIDALATWTEAFEICIKKGMHLVSIEKAAELKAISDFITRLKGGDPYLLWTSGLREKLGIYRWNSTGLRFQGVTWWHPYRLPPEPTERCVAMYKNENSFIDYLECGFKMNVLCEQ